MVVFLIVHFAIECLKKQEEVLCTALLICKADLLGCLQSDAFCSLGVIFTKLTSDVCKHDLR